MKLALRKRLVAWGGVALLVALAVAAVLWPQPEPVDLTTVTRGPMQVTLDHEGQTRVRDRFIVSAPVTGRVLRIHLEPGDVVEKDRTVLATLLPGAPALLDARARAESSARAGAAEAQVARATSARDEARAASEFAEREAQRARQLAAEHLLAAQGLEAAETDARLRARALQAAEAGVRAAERELEVARAALVERAASGATAGPSAGQVVLRSPVDGIVLRRIRESEAVVAQGEPLVEVANSAALEVIADYLSTDAVRIRPGMRALVDRWGGAAPFEGRVRRVEPAGFMKLSALGVEEQRVWVVVELSGAHGAWAALGDGYRVEARVVLWEQPDVLQVPSSALFRQGDAWAAFVQRDGRARLQIVRTGHRNGLSAEVLEGLSAGDRVIEHPSDRVADGVRITPRRLK